MLKLTPDYFSVLLTALGTWRLTCFLCYDNGPFQMMVAIRKLMYAMRIGSLLECFHCTGFWVSIIMVLFIFEVELISILLVLGVSGGASFMERILPDQS